MQNGRNKMSLRRFTGYRLIPCSKITTDVVYHNERMKRRQPTALLYQPDFSGDQDSNNTIFYNVVCMSPYQSTYRNTVTGVYARVKRLG